MISIEMITVMNDLQLWDFTKKKGAHFVYAFTFVFKSFIQ